MRKALFTFVAVASSSIAGAAQAQHAGDIEIVIEGGRLATPPRVFEAELGEQFPNFANEPGFDSATGTFQVGSSVGFNLLDALREWDGSDFDAIATETMTLSYQAGPTTLTTTTPTTANTTVNGFTVGVGANGDWHRHLGFTLDGAASNGIYLLKLDLFSTQTSSAIGNSEPLYIVFNQNSEEAAHAAATQFVETNIVPEPGGVMLIAVLGLAGLRSYR